MIKFAGPGKVYLRAVGEPDTKVRQLLWGDFLNVDGESGDCFTVRWGNQPFLVRKADCQDTRPLEVVFVDVGQGDGCLLVSPDVGEKEKVVLIDAGERRNMFNFVKWRFGKLKTQFRFPPRS